MSESEYMRKILESIDMDRILTEGYEDRVQAVADKIMQAYPDGISKNEFVPAVEKFAKEVGVVEMRPSKPGLNQKVSNSRREFLKDVKAKIGRFKSDSSKTDKKRERVNKILQKLSFLIDDAIGISFPDGDPFDIIFPSARELGIPADDVLKWLDLATKKYLGAKDYHTYLRDTWREHMDTVYPGHVHPNRDAF